MKKNPFFAPCNGTEPYIFASYSHDDAEIVTEDLNWLHKLGFKIWYDKYIGPTAEWRVEIGDFIENENCKVFLLFLSDNAISSDFVKDEISLARRRFHKKKLKFYTVFLEENTVIENNDLHQFIDDRQGNKRHDKPLNEYYDKLKDDLEELSKEVRLCPCERDSFLLGIGFLPSIKDIVNSQVLTVDEIENRRKSYVSMMLDTRSTAHKIDNIFQLTSDKTSALQNLEEIVNLGKDNYDFATSKSPCNLVSLPLDIGEAYLSPLRLINGLITRLDENWPPLVTSYGQLVKQSPLDLLDDLHYFVEFCWLAWGPSVLTVSKKTSDEKFVVLQAAYGDEANSLPLIIKRTLWQSIEARLSKIAKSYSGWPVSLSNVLLVKPSLDDYFSEVRRYPLFEDIFTKDETVALYLPDESEGYSCGYIVPLNQKKDEPDSFYSTAYVWLILEQVHKDGTVKRDHMEPGEVLPFFEHANLATKKGLEFLQHCLARKAIYHVLECELDVQYQTEGYYQFATALFPKEMLAILKQEIAGLNKDQKVILKKRLFIPELEKLRTPLDVVNLAEAINQKINDSLSKKLKKNYVGNSIY